MASLKREMVKEANLILQKVIAEKQ